QQLHSSLPPCPELRTNLVDHRDRALLHLACHPPVECRRVDDDGKIRSPAVSFFDQLMKQPPNLRKVIEDFSDADDRKVLGINHRVTPSSAHLLAANAKEFNCVLGSALNDRLLGR